MVTISHAIQAKQSARQVKVADLLTTIAQGQCGFEGTTLHCINVVQRISLAVYTLALTDFASTAHQVHDARDIEPPVPLRNGRHRFGDA